MISISLVSREILKRMDVFTSRRSIMMVVHYKYVFLLHVIRALAASANCLLLLTQQNSWPE